MIKKTILKFIKFYQVFISPGFSRNCRFWPSCSHYAYQVIEKYGVFKGLILGFIRVLKCHPWHPGGIDLP